MQILPMTTTNISAVRALFTAGELETLKAADDKRRKVGGTPHFVAEADSMQRIFSQCTTVEHQQRVASHAAELARDATKALA